MNCMAMLGGCSGTLWQPRKRTGNSASASPSSSSSMSSAMPAAAAATTGNDDVSSSLSFLTRKVKGSLNKLSVDKFNMITEEVALLLENQNDYKAVCAMTELVFDRAVLDPDFSEMYCDVLQVLKFRCPPVEIPPFEPSTARISINPSIAATISIPPTDGSNECIAAQVDLRDPTNQDPVERAIQERLQKEFLTLFGLKEDSKDRAPRLSSPMAPATTAPAKTTPEATTPATTLFPITTPVTMTTMPPAAMPPAAMPPAARPPAAMPPAAMRPETMPRAAMPPAALPPETMPRATVSLPSMSPPSMLLALSSSLISNQQRSTDLLNNDSDDNSNNKNPLTSTIPFLRERYCALSIFIGGLFVRRLIPFKTFQIYFCPHVLGSRPSENSLMYACKLLSTSGETLYRTSGNGKLFVNQMLCRMQSFLNAGIYKGYSNRIRYLIEDLILTRDRKWMKGSSGDFCDESGDSEGADFFVRPRVVQLGKTGDVIPQDSEYAYYMQREYNKYRAAQISLAAKTAAKAAHAAALLVEEHNARIIQQQLLQEGSTSLEKKRESAEAEARSQQQKAEVLAAEAAILGEKIRRATSQNTASRVQFVHPPLFHFYHSNNPPSARSQELEPSPALSPGQDVPARQCYSPPPTLCLRGGARESVLRRRGSPPPSPLIGSLDDGKYEEGACFFVLDSASANERVSDNESSGEEDDSEIQFTCPNRTVHMDNSRCSGSTPWHTPTISGGSDDSSGSDSSISLKTRVLFNTALNSSIGRLSSSEISKAIMEQNLKYYRP